MGIKLYKESATSTIDSLVDLIIKINFGGLNMLRRPRRLRASKAIRNLVRETKVNVEDLIYPLFVVEGKI